MNDGITYGGRCTACGLWIVAGPYFRRRIMRHLADWENHNHDAVAIFSDGPEEWARSRKYDIRLAELDRRKLVA